MHTKSGWPAFNGGPREDLGMLDLEFSSEDYRHILRLELKRRKALSPKYSMRDFAKDLGLFPSHMSYVLRNKKGLSRKSGRRIARRFAFTSRETQYFSLLVCLKSARSKLERNFARASLARPLHRETRKLLETFVTGKAFWREQVTFVFSRKPREEYRWIIQRLTSLQVAGPLY